MLRVLKICLKMAEGSVAIPLRKAGISSR